MQLKSPAPPHRFLQRTSFSRAPDIVLMALLVLPLSVGKELGAQAPSGDGDIPKVFLNHLYIVFDSETYRQITGSEELGEVFSAFGEKVETREGSWTNFSLFGEESYLELFEAVGTRAEKGGHIGIALSVHRQSDLDLIEARMGKAFGDRVERKTMSGVRKPWFDYLRIPREERLPTSVWIMEFRREHLDALDLKPDESGHISRLDYWGAWRARSPYPFRSLVRDIVGVELALPPDELNEFEGILDACSFARIEQSGQRVWTRDGLTFKTRLDPNPSMRTERLRLSLAEKLTEPRRIKVGNSVLVLGTDGYGTWDFRRSRLPE